MLETAIQILLLLPLIGYFCVKYYYNYWKRKGIPYVESIPWNFDWYNSSLFDYYDKIYRQLADHKFGGFFSRFSPKLMIRDPELIKCVLVKDFEYFHDRGDVIFDENEPITMHMFSAPGHFWRNLRSRLTPTFTSGKMKYMFSLVGECADELVQEVDKHVCNEDQIIDVKDFCTRYTIEVISSCAFGLKTNSIRNRDSTFKIMAHRIFERSISGRINLMTRSIFPWFKKAFKLQVINKSVKEFFYKLTEDNVEYRKSSSVDRNDFLQLLIKMQDDEKIRVQDGKIEMTNELMTAQCFLFFIAGFDTSSTVLSISLYELAANREIQLRLQNEIDTYLKRYNNEVTYEMMKSMPYLHQVVSETMRKYPVIAALVRVCAHNYQIPDTNVIIEKGTEVMIPLSGIHRDNKYFPDPDQFNPDRFKEENISSVNRFAYLPFGEGPRNCIGSRFGLMSVKLGLIHLLRSYTFEFSSKTQFPLEFAPFKIVTSINHGIFLKCNKK